MMLRRLPVDRQSKAMENREAYTGRVAASLLVLSTACATRLQSVDLWVRATQRNSGFPNADTMAFANAVVSSSVKRPNWYKASQYYEPSQDSGEIMATATAAPCRQDRWPIS